MLFIKRCRTAKLCVHVCAPGTALLSQRTYMLLICLPISWMVSCMLCSCFMSTGLTPGTGVADSLPLLLQQGVWHSDWGFTELVWASYKDACLGDSASLLLQCAPGTTPGCSRPPQ